MQLRHCVLLKTMELKHLNKECLHCLLGRGQLWQGNKMCHLRKSDHKSEDNGLTLCGRQTCGDVETCTEEPAGVSIGRPEDYGKLYYGHKQDQQRQAPRHQTKGRATRNAELKDSPQDDSST